MASKMLWARAQYCSKAAPSILLLLRCSGRVGGLWHRTRLLFRRLGWVQAYPFCRWHSTAHNLNRAVLLVQESSGAELSVLIADVRRLGWAVGVVAGRTKVYTWNRLRRDAGYPDSKKEVSRG